MKSIVEFLFLMALFFSQDSEGKKPTQTEKAAKAQDLLIRCQDIVDSNFFARLELSPRLQPRLHLGIRPAISQMHGIVLVYFLLISRP